MNGRKARTIRRLFGVPHVRKAGLTPEEIRRIPRDATVDYFLNLIEKGK